MLEKINTLIIAAALACLALAGLLLALGHNPDSFWFNFQAETLANFAYGLLVAGVVLRLFTLLKGSRS